MIEGTPIIKTGDTWPPLTLTLTETAEEDDPVAYTNSAGQTVRRLNLSDVEPDSLRLILKKSATPGTIVEGPMDNVEVVDGAGDLGLVEGEDPGLGVPDNRGQARYIWQAGDTDDSGGYKGEVELTWDAASSPPKVETVPNDDADNFDLTMDPDLD